MKSKWKSNKRHRKLSVRAEQHLNRIDHYKELLEKVGKGKKEFLQKALDYAERNGFNKETVYRKLFSHYLERIRNGDMNIVDKTILLSEEHSLNFERIREAIKEWKKKREERERRTRL